jgi:competence protein ComEA
MYLIIGLSIIVFISGMFTYSSDAPVMESSVCEKTESTVTYIYVDLKGEVVFPGVYKVEENARLYEVVNLAGGFTTEADSDAVNLSIILKDQDIVYIPNVQDEYPKIWIEQTSETGNNIVNINTASVEELSTLPGIGPAIAQKIIDYREENGPFETVNDIMHVSGIGEATFEEIADFIIT